MQVNVTLSKKIHDVIRQMAARERRSMRQQCAAMLEAAARQELSTGAIKQAPAMTDIPTGGGASVERNLF